MKSLVVGRPVLLALEDIDGTPSFLEKALKFIEQYGKTPKYYVFRTFKNNEALAHSVLKLLIHFLDLTFKDFVKQELKSKVSCGKLLTLMMLNVGLRNMNKVCYFWFI